MSRNSGRVSGSFISFPHVFLPVSDPVEQFCNLDVITGCVESPLDWALNPSGLITISSLSKFFLDKTFVLICRTEDSCIPVPFSDDEVMLQYPADVSEVEVSGLNGIVTLISLVLVDLKSGI